MSFLLEACLPIKVLWRWREMGESTFLSTFLILLSHISHNLKLLEKTISKI